MTPEELLMMDPLDALRAQIDEVLKPPMKAAYLHISEPESLGGVRTKVKASVDITQTPIELWDRIGVVEFEYDRIELDSFFLGANKTLKTTLPISDSIVFTNILHRYRIPVRAGDTAGAVFSDYGTLVLTAGEQSYRWVGSMAVNLERHEYDINEYLVNRHLPLMFDRYFDSLNIPGKLLFYVNSCNARSLPVVVEGSMYRLSEPRAVGRLDASDNTEIDMIFSGFPYAGVATIRYGRRAFQKTWRFPAQVAARNKATTDELASLISTQMKCTILPEDIVPEPLPQIPAGERERIIVKFKPESLAYVGDIVVDYMREA